MDDNDGFMSSLDFNFVNECVIGEEENDEENFEYFMLNVDILLDENGAVSKKRKYNNDTEYVENEQQNCFIQERNILLGCTNLNYCNDINKIFRSMKQILTMT